MSYSKNFLGSEWKNIEKIIRDNKLKINDELIYKIFNLKDADKVFDMYKKGIVKGKILLKCN